MKYLKKIAATLAILYVLLIVSLYLFQDKLLFHPYKLDVDYKESVRKGRIYEEFFLAHPNGIKINAQLIPSKHEAKGVVYYLHGNRGCIASQKIDLPYYLDRGYDAFTIDYQGFGKSEGAPSKIGLEHDVLLGYDFLATKYPQDSIIIVGHSMGSYPATFCATQRTPKSLILMTPIYKLKEVITCRIPFLIIPFDFRNNLDNSKIIDSINCPAHIFITKTDHMIPYKSAIKFKHHLHDKNTLTIAKRAGHNNMIRDKNISMMLDSILGKIIEFDK